MKPEGQAAREMAKVIGFVQRNPHDGAKVSEETEAYLGYDQKNLYVVFVCFDDPKKVRARCRAAKTFMTTTKWKLWWIRFTTGAALMHSRPLHLACSRTPSGARPRGSDQRQL